MEALVPAPVSIVTLQPRAESFFTVSGDAATRFSNSVVSFITAIFKLTEFNPMLLKVKAMAAYEDAPSFVFCEALKLKFFTAWA